VGGTLTEYTEHVIKFTCSRYIRKWYLAPRFLEFYSFHVLGNTRTLTAITRQHVACFLKAALLIVAQGLLNTADISNNFGGGWGEGD